MDFATLAGLIAGISIISAAVTSGSDFTIYINLPGFLIVIGGTAAAVLIKFPLKTCLNSFLSGLRTAFFHQSEKPFELITLAKKLSELHRRNGPLALEKVSIKNTFFRKGVQLIADGRNPDFLNKVLTLEMNHSIERNQVGERVFRAIGESSPAFGMIGTLVGLVQMLSNMQDPQTIGMGMAIALLTTLYGSLIANLVALPIADKLQMRYEAEHNNSALIVECILGIQKGENPRVMEEVLLTYLPGNARREFESQNNKGRAPSTKGAQK